MARVLVTYGWVRSSYAVVRSLGREGQTVYVGYCEPWSMAVHSRYCKKGVRLPDFFKAPETYVRAVAEACTRYGIDAILPGHEDLYWLARYRDLLPGGTKLVHSPVKSLEIAGNKARVVAWAKKVQCPVPRTHTFTCLKTLDRLAREQAYPAVLKTRTGNSAKGVCICSDPDQLCKKAVEWIDLYGLGPKQYPIIQEFLPGRAIGTCHLFAHGKPVASFAERYIRSKGGGSFGTSTFRCTHDAPEAVAAGNRLLKSLNWNGVAHLDFIADAQGTYRLIEANPRFWGALQLSIAAGINFPGLLLDCTLGRPVRVPRAPVKTISMRWILGETITLLTYLGKGDVKAGLAMLKGTGPGGFDDLFHDDPLPFFFQAAHYGKRFLASRSTNPIGQGMIQGG